MKKVRCFVLTILLAIGLPSIGLSADELLNPNHPERYVVKKGDTLWDIAGMFLNQPWRWPEIWHENPQIKNPHLIYPGDVLTLTYVNGQPRLVKNTDANAPREQLIAPGVVKLSPGIRVLPAEQAIPTIPLEAISPFMTQSLVLEEGVLEQAAYVLDFADDHMIGGPQHLIYARGISDWTHKNFDIVRKGRPLTDGQTGEVLAYAAQYAGNGELQKVGDPSTLLITSAEMHVAIGDYLLPVTNDYEPGNFHPKAPAVNVDGTIITALNGVTQIGRYDVVVIDRGAADGLDVGDVLQVNHKGELVTDPFITDGKGQNEKVQLPDEEAGLLMIFRTFDRISIALIMDAVRAMHVGDRVTNP